jgi:hypothetical protein
MARKCSNLNSQALLSGFKLEAGTERGPQRGSRAGVLESAFLTCEVAEVESTSLVV